MILGSATSTVPTLATDVVYPYTFTNGQILPAGQLNGNFDAVTDVVNGGITNGNISASAAITLSKLALTATALNLMATGNPTWAAGITGDTLPRVALYSQGSVGFGAGGASALDTFLFRTAANALRVQDAASTAFGSIELGSLKLTATNTATITPASMAASRAITLLDPLGAADLRCTTGTFNTNGIIYSDSNGLMKSTATGGAGTRVLTSVAGAAPAFTTVDGLGIFGGDGSDGAQTPSGVTTYLQINATTCTVGDGVTWQPACGTVLNATSTVTIGGGASGAVNISEGYPGGRSGDVSSQPTAGMGPCGGSFSIAANGGGGSGGATFYAPGGSGGCASGFAAKSHQGGAGGFIGTVFCGSGGGGGSSTVTGASGGAGGGRLTVCAIGAVAIGAGANLRALGVAGGAGATNGGGGGGGAGGVIIIASQTSIVNSGTVTATGGAGGNGAGTGGGGGGGAGGEIVFFSPSNTAGTQTVTGGAAGTGGATAAAAGTNGRARNITGTPNLPIISKIQNDPTKLAQIPSSELCGREVAALYAKDSAEYLHLCSGSLTETCEAIGDIEALSNVS